MWLLPLVAVAALALMGAGWRHAHEGNMCEMSYSFPTFNPVDVHADGATAQFEGDHGDYALWRFHDGQAASRECSATSPIVFVPGHGGRCVWSALMHSRSARGCSDVACHVGVMVSRRILSRTWLGGRVGASLLFVRPLHTCTRACVGCVRACTF
jgi:hypothetical protein